MKQNDEIIKVLSIKLSFRYFFKTKLDKSQYVQKYGYTFSAFVYIQRHVSL